MCYIVLNLRYCQRVILFLVLVFYSRCVSAKASYSNETLSSDARGTKLNAQSSNALFRPSEVSTSSSTSGCEFDIPGLYVYYWRPDIPSANITISHPTNSEGTRVTTVPLTTGASNKDGNLVFLTSSVVLTFPTGLTSYALTYNVYSTKGSSTLSTTSSTLTTLLPYDFTQPVPTPPENDLKGNQYTLSTASLAGDEIFLASAYPAEKAFQTCSPVGWKGTIVAFGLPPEALQFAHLIPVSPTVASAQNALMSTKLPAALSAVATLAHPSKHGESNRGSGNNTGARTRTQNAPKTRGETRSTSSRTNRVPAANSANRHEIGIQSLSTEISSSSTEGPTLSLKAGTASSGLSSRAGSLINEKTAQDSKASTTTQIVHGLTVQGTTGSKVIINGHPMELHSTLTLGSGSIRTRLALATSSHETIVLAATVTVPVYSVDTTSSITADVPISTHPAPSLTHPSNSRSAKSGSSHVAIKWQIFSMIAALQAARLILG